MTDAADKDVGILDGPEGRQYNMVGTPEGLPLELAALKPRQLWDPRGHTALYLRGGPPRRRGGVEQLSARHRHVAQLALITKLKEALVGAGGPLPQDRRHTEAGVRRPNLGGEPG